MESFYTGLADILEVPVGEINPAFILVASQWDSLAIISCLALIDECFGIIVPGTVLAQCRMVADLLELLPQTV